MKFAFRVSQAVNLGMTRSRALVDGFARMTLVRESLAFFARFRLHRTTIGDEVYLSRKREERLAYSIKIIPPFFSHLAV